MNQEGKNKRRGAVVGKTAKTKKAIVQLTEDSARYRDFLRTVKSGKLS